jgi:hypothetical protein
MRVLREIPNPHCKITLFAWNNRYLIKLEQGLLEQTFKVNEFDVSGDDEIVRLVDEEFVQQALTRFLEMGRSLYEAKERLS